MLQNYTSQENEIKSLNNKIENSESTLKEKCEIINQLENYIKELELLNSKIKKEFEMLKYYSENHFSLFTLKFCNEDIDLSSIKKLEQKLDDNEYQIQILNKEKEILLNKNKQYEESFTEINKDFIIQKNKYLEKEKELFSVQNNATNLKNHQINLDKEMTIKENDINNYKNEIFRLKEEVISLIKEKEKLLMELNKSINETGNKVTEVKNSFSNLVQKLVSENENMKSLLKNFKDEIVKDILNSNLNAQQGNIDNIISNQTEEIQLSLISQKLKEKEKEYLKIKNLKNELEIRTENLSIENNSLKYKIEFLENRVNYYQNLISSNNNNKDRIETQENINQNIQNEDTLYQNFLNSLKEMNNLKTENNLLNLKIEKLKNLNDNLVKNDLGASYKYLFNKIEQLNLEISSLETQNKMLIEEKEKIIKDFVFINENSNSLIKTQQILEKTIKNANDKISLLEISLEEQIMLNNKLSQSKVTIEEQEYKINNLENMLSNFNNEINELTKIKNEQSISLEEKNTIINDLNNQINKIVENSDSKLRSELEEKNKEMSTNKIVNFRNFYVAFKRAKAIIEFLMKFKETLETKINQMENIKTVGFDENTLNEINSKLNQYDVMNNSLSKYINNILEKKIIGLEEVLKVTSKELELSREREKFLSNEVKTFKSSLSTSSFAKVENAGDMKVYFFKLLNNMKSATNIINFKDSKIKDLEKEIELFNKKMKDMESTIFSTCPKCSAYTLEIKTLMDANSKLNASFKSECKNNFNFLVEKRDLIINKLQFESGILSKDLKSISEHMNRPDVPVSNLSNVPSNIPSNPQQKAFSQLLTQMRKATKVISLLDNNLKNLSSKIEK